MIIQGQKVLYNNTLQPAQIFLNDDGMIANINLTYDPRLKLTTDEVCIAFTSNNLRKTDKVWLFACAPKSQTLADCKVYLAKPMPKKIPWVLWPTWGIWLKGE